MLSEARSAKPNFRNIFNDSAPLLTRPPDNDNRRAAYSLTPAKKHTPGGPHDGAVFLPAVWAVGQKILRTLQPLYEKELMVNDVGYVEAKGKVQVMHADLIPSLCSPPQKNLS